MYVDMLNRPVFLAGMKKYGLEQRLGEKAWGGKKLGEGESKNICVLMPKVIASRRINSLLWLCPREVMLLFFVIQEGDDICSSTGNEQKGA